MKGSPPLPRWERGFIPLGEQGGEGEEKQRKGEARPRNAGAPDSP